jgi:AcrR family transcriptional regulator
MTTTAPLPGSGPTAPGPTPPGPGAGCGLRPVRNALAAAGQRLGLRERKKLKTRAAIREAADRLIAEQGYEATTVERIAEAAEVSPSTVFRYFPSKEDIVLTDEYDRLTEAALRARPPAEDPLDALLHAVRESLVALAGEEESARVRRSTLVAEVPAVRARLTETMTDGSRRLARVLAERTGRGPADPEVRVLTAAVTGAARETVVCWAEDGHRDDLLTLFDRTAAVLRGGLRF